MTARRASGGDAPSGGSLTRNNRRNPNPNTNINYCKKAKVSSYTAQHPVLIAQSALNFNSPADLFNQAPSRLLWKVISHAAINARRPIVPICTPVYSELSELEQYRVSNFAQGLTQQHRIRTRVLIVKSRKLYP